MSTTTTSWADPAATPHPPLSSTALYLTCASPGRFAERNPRNYGRGGVRPVILGSFGDAVLQYHRLRSGPRSSQLASNASHSELDMGGAASLVPGPPAPAALTGALLSPEGIINHVGAEAMVTVAPLSMALLPQARRRLVLLPGHSHRTLPGQRFSGRRIHHRDASHRDYRAAVASAPPSPTLSLVWAACWASASSVRLPRDRRQFLRSLQGRRVV